MNYLQSEILEITQEHKERSNKNYDTKVFIKMTIVMTIILIGLFCRGHSEELECPFCGNEFEVICITEAKEIPGAGWKCDKCGKWATQGQKCVWCGAKRK